MAFDKTNRFSLFNNDKKEPGSKQPDRTGTLNVDGKDYFIDGWLQKDQNGNTYLSGKIKLKEKQALPFSGPTPDESDAVPF